MEVFGETLEEEDVIVVSQVDPSNRVFRSSMEYVYKSGKLIEKPVEEKAKNADETY